MRIFEPAGWEIRPERRLLIGEGRVDCPVRGEVDVEVCFGCRRMVAVVARGDPSYVACRSLNEAARPARA